MYQRARWCRRELLSATVLIRLNRHHRLIWYETLHALNPYSLGLPGFEVQTIRCA
jgi:hypothetical protein